MLSQVYPMMMATALSIHTDNLSLYDAHSSPASAVFSALKCPMMLLDPPWRITPLDPPLYSSRLEWFTFRLRIVLPILWLAISVIVSFDPVAFRNSPEYCQKMTFIDWFEFQLTSNFLGVFDVLGRRDIVDDIKIRRGLGTILLILVYTWGLLMVRQRHRIASEIRLRLEAQKKHGLLRKSLSIILVIPVSWWVPVYCLE